MTKIFEFMHQRTVVRAIAIFNFEHQQYSAMIMPYTHKTELGNTIMVTKKNNKWINESSICCNSTYINMLCAIDAIMKQHEAFTDVLLQEYLS